MKPTVPWTGFSLFLDLYTYEVSGSILLWNLISWSLGIVIVTVIVPIFILTVISSYFVSWSWMKAFNLWYSFIEQYKLKSWITCLHLVFIMNCYLLYVCHYLCIMYRATYWKRNKKIMPNVCYLLKKELVCFG